MADLQNYRHRTMLEIAADYDTALIGLYKSILKQPIGEIAASLLESLLKVEERDVVMIKKMIAMDYF